MSKRPRLSLTSLEDRWTPAAGDLDPTFGTGGQTTLKFPDGFVPVRVVSLPDGAVVMAGNSSGFGSLDFAAVRLTADGQLDPSFGTNGRAVVPIDFNGPAYDLAAGVAVQSDGRVLLAGRAGDASAEATGSYASKWLAVARLTTDGQTDPTFGTAGKVVIDVSGGLSTAAVYYGSVTEMPDGKIVVIATVSDTIDLANSASTAVVVRLTAGGLLDHTFGVSGVARFNDDNGISITEGVTALPDGRVIVAGEFRTATKSSGIATVRLNVDGTLDTGFGVGGRASYLNNNPLSMPELYGARAVSLAVRQDGAVVIAGTQSAPNFRFQEVVLRLSPDGAFDTSFSGDGVFVGEMMGPGNTGQGVSFTRDDAVVMVSGHGYGTVTTFASDGSEVSSSALGDELAIDAVSIQPNGQVITTVPLSYAPSTIVRVARLLGSPRPKANTVTLGGSSDGVALLATIGGGLGDRVPVYSNFTGAIRTATADVNGDGVPDLIAGTGPGGGPNVVVISGATGQKIADLSAFELSFTGGVFVAAADLNGDGKAEVVVTPDQGGGPVVVVFDGAGLAAGKNEAAQLARFYGIEDLAFRGGARPALGDVNADGTPDLVVAAGFGGGPRVAVYNGRTLFILFTNNPLPGLAQTTQPASVPPKLVGDFFVFEDTLRNGVFVAAGDLTGDGAAEVIVGGGPGGGPRVFALDGRALAASTQAVVANFFAGDPNSRGGVRVAVRPDAAAQPQLITGSGDGEAARVRVYKPATARSGGTPDQELIPFGGAILTNGVFVG